MPETSPVILVVDDTEASRYAVSHILRKAGFTVLEAANGAQALHLLQQKPDLAILDINLPDMSGYEVCQRIKTAPATASVLVMHLSASFVESEHRSQGLEKVADGYLTYPLEPRELIANVQAMLRLRHAEKAMRSQRELLRITLNSIGDAIIATDTDEIVTFINPVAQVLIGWSEEECVGKPLSALFHIVNEETGQAAESPVAKVIASGSVAGLANHTILISRDGTRRPIDDTAAPIRNEDGHFVGVILVFRDITERRRLERGELHQRSLDLVERDRRKDEFLAVLAHELRNPLAPIANTLQVLRLQFAGHPAIEHAGAMMERQLSHLVRLVDDLLDVSRITRGKFELRKQPIELAMVVDRTVESVRALVNERQHHLRIELPAQELWLEADPDRVEQVLANLLNNAAKYTSPGGEILLSAQREGGDIVLRVRDNGIGIRAEAMPQLFDLFHQADRVPGRVSEGLGIGLTLVRNLVEMHGGSVSATSGGPNQGSEFVVRLPALPSNSGTAPPVAVEPSSPVRPLRILVTDDNRDSAESMAMLLAAMGHETRTAYDGAQSLHIVKEFLPHVILLDIGLPHGLDGYELARRLREQSGLEKALLVAMTGYGQEEDRHKSKSAGFDYHLVKPADLTEINRLLADAARS